MFTEKTSDNTVIHSALSIRYSVNSKAADGKWEVHRYITGSYSVVGLDYASAITVANQELMGLKRTYYLWTEDEDGERVRFDADLCTDEVAAVHEDGPMWRVDVNINEDDVNYVDDVESDLSLAGWPYAYVLESPMWGAS